MERGNEQDRTNRACCDSDLNHHHSQYLETAMASERRARLPRNAKKNVDYTPPATWDPNVPSDDPHIQKIESLNQEAFPHAIAADADDFIMNWLFGSKLTARWSSVTPQRASNPSALENSLLDNLSENTLLEINRACRSLTHPKPDDDLFTTVDECMSVLLRYPKIHSKCAKWKACARQ